MAKKPAIPFVVWQVLCVLSDDALVGKSLAIQHHIALLDPLPTQQDGGVRITF